MSASIVRKREVCGSGSGRVKTKWEPNRNNSDQQGKAGPVR